MAFGNTAYYRNEENWNEGILYYKNYALDSKNEKINKIVTSRLQMSTTSIKKNYFNYLKEKYEKYGIDNPLDLYITETHKEEVS